KEVTPASFLSGIIPCTYSRPPIVRTYSSFNCRKIDSIRFPYSCASSNLKINSGTFRRRIRLPTSDRTNPLAFAKPTNVSLFSFSSPNTDINTVACCKSLDSSTSVTVTKPTRGSFILRLKISPISFFICSAIRFVRLFSIYYTSFNLTAHLQTFDDGDRSLKRDITIDCSDYLLHYLFCM